MADEPRQRRPSIAGVELPPKRREPDRRALPSLPPEDREQILAWLKLVHDTQQDAREESTERYKQTEQRQDDFERRLYQVESAVLRVQTLDLKFDNLTEKIGALLASDTRQNAEILSLGQRKEMTAIAAASSKEATAEATEKSDKKLRWRTALVLVISAVFSACGEAAFEALKKALNQ